MLGGPFRRFGEYGISVLAAPDDASLDGLTRGTLRREAILTGPGPVHVRHGHVLRAIEVIA